jgi:tripartite-type tricarboxylate transporter receptor subunit TctC
VLKLKTWLIATALTLTGLNVAAPLAQSGPEYFNGKTVNFIVATDPGGGYDAYGRLTAEFMQKHLPGSTFVVRNMPGAGHIIGANYIYASEPNGLTIGTFNTGLIYSQLVGDDAIRFDLGNMSWVGKVAADPRVLLMSTQSGIKTFEELMAQPTPIKWATCGVGCASTVEGRLLKSILDLPIDIITGYDGSEDQMALRRGEAFGMIASKSSVAPMVRDGHAHYIAQIGGDSTDAPQLSSLTDDPAALRAIALMDAQVRILRFIAGPPAIPEDILGTLQDAFAAAVADPEFHARAESMGLPIDPLVGNDVRDAIVTALNQDEATISFLRDALAK